MVSRRAVVNSKPRHLSGWIPDRGDHRDVMYHAPVYRTSIPRAVDLRPNCSRVEDQGEIGSCTANSSTSAMEFLYRKMGLEQPELSRQFLYFATRVWVAKGSPAEDSGAMLRDVMKALVLHGTCLENVWPYRPEIFEVEPTREAEVEAQNHQVQKYFRVKDLGNMKVCMAEGYPVIGGFSVPTGFMSEETAKTGIAKYPEKDEEFCGGHAVLFVGYDDATRLLTFQNSWGEKWGDGGFGYLPYDFVLHDLADDFWTIRRQEM